MCANIGFKELFQKPARVTCLVDVAGYSLLTMSIIRRNLWHWLCSNFTVIVFGCLGADYSPNGESQFISTWPALN
jgi:hypothetical protein